MSGAAPIRSSLIITVALVTVALAAASATVGLVVASATAVSDAASVMAIAATDLAWVTVLASAPDLAMGWVMVASVTAAFIPALGLAMVVMVADTIPASVSAVSSAVPPCLRVSTR